MTETTHVLLVEDNPGDVDIIREGLLDVPAFGLFELETADRLGTALPRVASTHAIDVVLLDLGLPDSTGLETLLEVKRAAPLLPVVVMTGRDDKVLAMRALEHGAQDYLVKGRVDGELVARSILLAIGRQQAESARIHLAEERAARAAAEDALRFRDEFIAIASHELRNPLAPLMLNLEVLREMIRGGTPGDQAGASSRLGEKLDGAIRAVKQLTKLVEGMLDVSRITVGRLQLDLERIELCQAVREVVDRFSAEASSAGCTLTFRAVDGIIGIWDRLRLDQMVTNLLSNAVKYGAGKPIEITAVSDGTDVALTVRDHGIGIDRGDLARIFLRFERAGPRLPRRAGLGLGLYITQQIAQAHGGSVEAWSEVGVGSSFTLRLPLLPPDEGTATSPA